MKTSINTPLNPPAASRFEPGGTPLPDRLYFPPVAHGATAGSSTAQPRDGVETHFAGGYLAISIDVNRLGMVISGGYSPEIAGTQAPLFVKATSGPFHRALWGQWCSLFRWMGLAGRPVAPPLPEEIPAHAGQPQPSASIILRPAPHRANARKFRDSMEFAQWRISAWEAVISDAGPSVPAGLFFQVLFRALVNPESAGHRFLRNLRDPRRGNDRRVALSFHPVGYCIAFLSQLLGNNFSISTSPNPINPQWRLLESESWKEIGIPLPFRWLGAVWFFSPFQSLFQISRPPAKYPCKWPRRNPRPNDNLISQ